MDNKVEDRKLRLAKIMKAEKSYRKTDSFKTQREKERKFTYEGHNSRSKKGRESLNPAKSKTGRDEGETMEQGRNEDNRA